MVRFQKRCARKRYLKSKQVYEYERISLHIPKEFHEAVRPYLKEDLDLKVTTERARVLFCPAARLTYVMRCSSRKLIVSKLL
jgi:hypothetical protein